MEKLRNVLILTFLLCLTGSTGWASVAYITDTFEVTLRTGPSTENKIIFMPSSGQGLEVVETQGDWSRVRFSKRDGEGVEGWILSRYLISRAPWELQAKTLKDENAALKERLARVERELGEKRRGEEDASGKLQATTAELDRLRTQYESFKKGAADYLTLKSSFDTTKSALETSNSRLEQISAENEELKSSQRNRWVLTGAGILLCGLMIGLVMGRQQKKRRSLYV